MLEKEEEERTKVAWIHVRYEMFVTGFLQALLATLCTIYYVYIHYSILYTIQYTVYCSIVYTSLTIYINMWRRSVVWLVFHGHQGPAYCSSLLINILHAAIGWKKKIGKNPTFFDKNPYSPTNIFREYFV